MRGALTYAACLAYAGLLCAPPLHGQIPDTLLQADTTFALPPRPPVPFRQGEPSWSTTRIAPALTSLEDAAGALAGLPGSFAYDFGAYGWPDGWSPYGIAPNRIALQFMGIPFDDPVTGRPLLDFLPVALLEPLGLQPARLGAPVGVVAEPRRFRGTLTELHYQAGGNGLQRVTAMHRQERALGPGTLAALFAYEGGAARGEYPGSRLRRRRQVLLRARYRHARFSLEALLLHNRLRLGAHGGVIPVTPYEAIYNRLVAEVHDAQAVRQTLRTDFSTVARFRLLPRAFEPLAAQAFMTSHMLKYSRTAKDTLRANVRRLGARLHQDIRVGRHRIRVLAEAWSDRVTGGSALPRALSRTRLSISLRDSVSFGNLTVMAEGGAYPAGMGGALHVSRRIRSANVFAEASSTGRTASWIEEAGWGGEAKRLERVPAGRFASLRAGLHAVAGPLDLEAFGFATRESAPVDLHFQEAGHIAALVSESATAAGLAADVGFRRAACRGFYVTAQPTVLRPDGMGDRVLPAFFVRGHLGARYALFTGDLRLDLSVRAQYWSDMRSRLLHAPTGLLALAGTAGDRYPPGGVLPASHTLDLVALAEVRRAHLFVTWENVLSGTVVLAGNQIVPAYPLPARNLRFGVFWPILN